MTGPELRARAIVRDAELTAIRQQAFERTQGGILIPADPPAEPWQSCHGDPVADICHAAGRPDPRKAEAVIPPEWAPYLGQTSTPPPEGTKWGGGASFAAHLGRPLSPALWDDLFGRLDVRCLWLFRYGMCEKTVPPLQRPAASVYLDEAGKVEDIYYYAR